MLSFENIKIAVIGQGNVGLPLAIAFGKKYKTTPNREFVRRQELN